MTSGLLDRLSNTLLHEDIEKDQYDSNTLSHRLKLCLKLYSISQSELARLINVKPQIIQYLCTKNVKSSRFTFELADALGVDDTWLSAGEGAIRQPIDNKNEEHKIPLFSWDKLDQITNNDTIKNHYGEYILSSINAKGRIIATKIDDTSMEPRFEKGTTIIVNLDEVRRHGDFVLVKLAQTNTWVFRELMFNKQRIELFPINNSIFKEIIVQPEDKITGILIQAIYDVKRERS